MKLLAQILIIYNWGVVCILLLFLFNIARFFEERLLKKISTARKQMYFPFFLMPILVFAISAFMYAGSDRMLIAGNFIADILRIIGGLVLGLTGYSVLNTMIGGRS